MDSSTSRSLRSVNISTQNTPNSPCQSVWFTVFLFGAFIFASIIVVPYPLNACAVDPCEIAPLLINGGSGELHRRCSSAFSELLLESFKEPAPISDKHGAFHQCIFTYILEMQNSEELCSAPLAYDSAVGYAFPAGAKCIPLRNNGHLRHR